MVLLLPEVAMQAGCVGVPAAVTYFVARERSAVWLIVRPLIAVAVAQCLLITGLLLLLTHAFLGTKEYGTQVASLLTIASLPLLMTQYYGTHILQGLGDLRLFNAFKLASPGVFAIGLGLGLFIGLTVVTCTVIWLIGRAAVTLALIAILIVRVRRASSGHDHDRPVPTRREVGRFAIFGFLAQVSPAETFRVDTLVVAGLFSSQVVGYYAVAMSISNAPRFIADAIVTVAYPHIAAQGARAGQASTKRYLSAAAIACGGTSIVLALASPYIIPVLFGESFMPAVVISVFLVVAAGLISLRRVGTDCLRALGRPGVTTGIEVVTFVVLAAGFTGLGPWKQGIGVAVTMVFAAVAGLILTLGHLRVVNQQHSPL